MPVSLSHYFPVNPIAVPQKRKKHRSNRNWINRHVSDGYVRKARQDGYRARSVYKLEEIDRRSQLLAPGMRVVDLGAAPGGWSQYAAKVLHGNGRLIAVDLLPMDSVKGAVFTQGDFTDPAVQKRIMDELGGRAPELVLSDMAPNLSGIPTADQARSIGLAEEVLYWCRNHLAPQGSLLIKVFQGSGFDQLREQMLQHFASVSVRKPDASRSSSAEVYLLARGFRGGSGGN